MKIHIAFIALFVWVVMAATMAARGSQVWGGPPYGQETVSFFSGGTYLPTTGTNYVSQGYLGGGSQNSPFVAARSGYLNNCTVNLSAAQAASNGYTVYVYKNGAQCTTPSAISLNFVQATQKQTDSTHACSVSQGDLVSLQFVVTGTATTAIASGSCLY